MLIQSLLEDFYLKLNVTKNAVRRRFSFPNVPEMIKVAIGVRRCGKTYFLYQTIHQLLAEGTPLESILYINFEDDRLSPLNKKGLADILESFFSMYPENHKRRCYLFLDEIQNVEQWQLVVRRFFDTRDVQIYLTGSSAKLLSKEIATSLRGRSIAIELWPYDFAEFIQAHKITLPSTSGKIGLDFLNKYFHHFLNIGGFPAVQSLEDTTRRETLQNYVETVIFRDVVERHNVSNIALLKYLVQTLLKNFSAPFSNHKFFNDIKSQGFPVSKDTIYNYISYLEDAYLVASVPIYSESLRKSHMTPKKIYIVDCGMILANVFSQLDNFGRLFENLIYLILRRENRKIFFYTTKSGYEIDFVTQSSDGKREIIQVVWDLNDPETSQREKRALEEAIQELQIPGRIIDKNTYLENFLKEDSHGD